MTSPFNPSDTPSNTVQIQLLRGASERAIWRRGTVVYVQSGGITFSQCLQVLDSSLRISQQLNEGEAHIIEFTACYDILARRDAVLCCEVVPSWAGLIWRGLKRVVFKASTAISLSAGHRARHGTELPKGRATAGP